MAGKKLVVGGVALVVAAAAVTGYLLWEPDSLPDTESGKAQPADRITG